MESENGHVGLVRFGEEIPRNFVPFTLDSWSVHSIPVHSYTNIRKRKASTRDLLPGRRMDLRWQGFLKHSQVHFCVLWASAAFNMSCAKDQRLSLQHKSRNGHHYICLAVPINTRVLSKVFQMVEVLFKLASPFRCLQVLQFLSTPSITDVWRKLKPVYLPEKSRCTATVATKCNWQCNSLQL